MKKSIKILFLISFFFLIFILISNGTSKGNFSQQKFKKVLDCIDSIDIEVKTIKGVLKK